MEEGQASATPGSGPPLFDPHTLSVRRGPNGALRVSDAQATHLYATCYRAFPLSDPEEWIVFFDAQGTHLGVLGALGDLDPDSRAACREELELRYVVPRVTALLSVREESGEHSWRPAQVWDVRTDRGTFRLHLPNVTDHVRTLADGALVLNDRDGRRCLLREADLDPAGRTLLRRYLWGGDL